jgi:hypothetical protein
MGGVIFLFIAFAVFSPGRFWRPLLDRPTDEALGGAVYQAFLPEPVALPGKLGLKVFSAMPKDSTCGARSRRGRCQYRGRWDRNGGA